MRRTAENLNAGDRVKCSDGQVRTVERARRGPGYSRSVTVQTETVVNVVFTDWRVESVHPGVEYEVVTEEVML